MFEGLVRQLLLGYLGQYIKDIQKEQLKITLWNEEVLLENVELILEAFDYLQLPFALKQGHVGKLSIKIPWKKLGWDPIIIILEDVVICACRREDKEWSSDAIERREFAGKKAKLATAELAKLSRRVCDNQTGKSFISYITAKILDGIQVSIRNVHVQYRDILTASGGTLFGLKFSGLTIMRQNSSGVSSGKVRGGQVNKLIKVQGLGFYCSTFEGTFDLVSMDDAIRGNHQGSARCEDNKDAYMLAPFEVSVFLSVNRSGKLENDAPQYSMNVELTRLVISINEVQLQEILTIYDYFSTCQLREKYGRYRPWWSPLEKKLDGWQTSWWRYAQESVLSDVKKRLRKTSWKYLGDRLKCRRKYVNLYKTKLKCLQEDQVIDENVLSELEEMEKESDIDDILSYRSSAERELQDFLLNSFSSGGSNSSNPDKSLEDEQASGKARGWLNWLSRGMLGAGGTDDSSQFSGVISDDVIQDIYEATKFRPVTPLNGDAAATDKIYLSSAKLNIREISATLRSLKLGYAIACLVLEDISAECKIWDESATIIASLSSARILNPLDMQAVLFTRMVDFGKGVAEVQQPVLNMQVDALPPNADVSLSVKVIIQPMEIFCDLQFINSIMEFYYILEHVSFQYERILLCLNGIDDVKARLVSKTEFVLLNRKRMMWDVNFINIAIVIPWGNTDSKPHQMVFEAGEVSLLSIDGVSSLHSDMQNQSYINSKYINCSTSSDDLLDFELQDLYNNFKINIGYFEMKILMAYSFGPAPLLEKSSASLTLVSCIIPDEPMMKGLDVNIRVSSLLAHFSPSIYKAIMGLVTHINMMNCISDSASLKTVDSNNIKPNGQMTYHAFWFSIIANLESVSLQLDLENDKKNSYTLTIGLLMLSLWFDKKECPECWASTKALRIISYQGQVETLILSSSENLFTSESTEHSDITFRLGNQSGNFTDNSSFTDGCLLFQYQAYRNLRCICHKYKIWLNNVDIHCYPFIVGLLAGFCDKIFGYDKPVVGDENPIKDVKSFPLVPAFELQRFGFSNVSETGSPECVSIPLDSFPFVTIQNRGSLPSLESSSISAISEWRKEVNLRDWKSRSSSFIAEKELECIDATLKSASGVESLPPNWNENDIIKVDLSIGSIKVHFHDSSCILGTVSISVSESLFSICGDHFDILCSTDGLTLSCSWWSPMIHDFLWGPLLPDLSAILNIRVKKENAGLEKYRLCISFGIQHVACILSPDFLALLIGYFSLPEWKCGATEQSFSGNSEYVNSDDKVAIEYKFEILDSNLLIPASFDGFQFLKLDIQQLYCSFIQSSGRDAAMKDIPSECLVMTDKIADRNNCLNLIGRDLSLSLLLPRDDVLQSSSLNQVSGWRNFTLIAPFGADVWVRIPRQCETAGVGSSYPTCVMAAATNCRVNAEGACVIFGYEALENVINEFSLIDEKSHAFTGDSVLFLQLMRGLVENAASSPEASSVTSIEIRFCVRSMTIRLQQSVKDSMTSEVIADAEMQFACSASLVNDKPVFLDISFSSLTLFSLLNSVMLAECTTTCSSSSALRVTLSVSEQGENKFHMCLPSLDIWLHRYDWSKVNDVFISYCGELSKNSVARHSSNSLIFNSKDLVQDLTVNVSQDSLQSPNASSSLRPENFQQDSSFYLLQLEKIGIKVHIPAQVNGDECGVFSKLNLNDSAIKTCGDQLGFVTFSVQTKPSELVIDGETMRMKINLEKARGTVELFGDTDEVTWPLFQLSQILLEGKIINYQMEHICVKCDTLDVWLSSHFVHLWCFMQFKVPESGPSHTPFSNVDLKVQLRKFTLLFTDGKWSPSGSLLEVVMRNIFFLSNMTDGEMDGSVEGDLQVNYNNIDKVLWEPFMEPWGMQLAIARRHDKSALLNSVITTNIQLKSKSQLNLNVTESLIEVVSRTIAMIEDSWSVMRMAIPSEGHGFPSYQINRNLHRGRDAPYIIQNLTSLPLVFHVCKGKPSSGDLDIDSLPSQDGNILQPGSSAPVYVDETPEEQLVRHRPSQSSDRLSDKHVLQAGHRYILIQFEGTSTPSGPVSMDLVGLRYFEVDFSKSSNKAEVDPVRDTVRSNKVEGDWSCGNSGFVVPVVIDVSVERHIKLIRLYSTVVLLNATPVPLEVRFDIPFGVSPKILDPVYPGHEFPLPLHLAEAGFMRWRPLGNTYLWSEAYSISKILSHENKISFSRSIVCYPSHPSSDPFRCCIWVNGDCLHSVGKKGLCLSKSYNKKEITESSDHSFHNPDTSEQRFIYWVTLSCPLVLKNYLPEAVSLILENGSVTRNALLSEVETSFFHIDSSHDLTITLRMRGFKSSTLKFQRAETFCSTAKFDGSKLFLSETITFYPESFDGPLCVNVDKIMDGFSGAREVCISVPFLLCNCTGFPLVISNSLNEIKGHGITIPSCYDLDADYSLGRKDGLAILSSNQDLHTAADADKFMVASSKSHITTKSNEYKSLNKPLNSIRSSTFLQQSSQNYDPNALKVSVSTFNNEVTVSSQSNLKSTAFVERDNEKIGACMYSPDANSSPDELMVRVSRYFSGCITGNVGNGPWSSPFPLVPPTGSITVLVPQPPLNTSHVVSVSAVAAPFSGRTRIITFQPRYVISNACNKALYYKQKGTDFVFLLDAGQHANIQWTDTTRDLLVSVRFDEPGWQWSGCFLPEHLGDTQVKIHNYLSGVVIMMRVEVQTADLSIKDEKVVGSPRGNSGTHIILVSVDDTGFMPYRIDNFSKERLRIYQQKCETFETLVNSYTSCPYAWDEPCYPHRLTVEVTGVRVIGSYALDDAKDFSPVYLPASSEKPERTLFVSVHSEGAIKVLSIIDSTYHNLSDLKSPDVPQLNYKRNHAQKHEIFDHYTERIAIEIPFIGISLMNSFPKELLFACAKGVAVDLMQSLDQQKFALQISSLQIDNQLYNTPYPVILSFDCDNKGHPVNQIKMIDDPTKITGGIASDKSIEPVFSLAVAKWRNKDITVVSFEYISLRVADFHLELEQEIVLSLVDFLRAISSRLESRVLHHMGSTLHPFFPDLKAVSNTSAVTQANKFVNLKGKLHFSDERAVHEDQKRDLSLGQVIPIGAPWQQIHLLARQQKKIYVELLDLAPVKLSLSFSSSPWTHQDGVLVSGESLIHRGLVALADIEGAKIHLKQLSLSHQLASWESIQEILIRHYTRQFIHDIYKLFGSAGVLGNPMGFARTVGLGIKDFLSVPIRSVFQSPAGLITGMAQGTTSLLSNTVYAISDAATQFSKVTHKGIVAFTFDDQIVAKMEMQQKGMTSSHNKGLINGFFEGLTGLLQSPIKGAEKHGIPGVLSGIALGVTGLVARPAASILEVTGKTAQSIRNRSRVHRMGSQRLRVRLPRPLSKESVLKPYSWEEAVGTSVLAEADDGMKLRDEILMMCKRLKQGGKYVIITERLILVVSCSSLGDLGKSTFQGIPAEPEWVIETDIGLDSIIHADNNEEVVHIVGSSSDPLLRQNQNQHIRVVAGNRGKLWNQSPTPSPVPLFHVNLEFMCNNDAENFLRVLLSTIEKGKDQGWGCVHLLHQSNLK